MSGVPKDGCIKGGKSQPPEQRTFSRNKQLAIEAGRMGGKKAQANRRRKREEKENG